MGREDQEAGQGPGVGSEEKPGAGKPAEGAIPGIGRGPSDWRGAEVERA